MPELPEVEFAARIARRAVRGRVIAHVDVRHAAQRRALPVRAARSLAGDRVVRVERRAKYQLLRLASGRTLVVHFRMTGDWVVQRPGEGEPPHARIVIAFTDGSALVFDDPRALGSVTLVEQGNDALPALGPEATGRGFTAAWLQERAARRAVSIKAALLDQGVVAGVGNIYASEALWLARIDPRRRVDSLDASECARVVAAVKRVMRRALSRPARYYQVGADQLRFAVYDREGAPCRRCRTPIARLVQAGRSTYWCRTCQGLSPSPRRVRP